MILDLKILIPCIFKLFKNEFRKHLYMSTFISINRTCKAGHKEVTKMQELTLTDVDYCEYETKHFVKDRKNISKGDFTCHKIIIRKNDGSKFEIKLFTNYNNMCYIPKENVEFKQR